MIFKFCITGKPGPVQDILEYEIRVFLHYESLNDNLKLVLLTRVSK